MFAGLARVSQKSFDIIAQHLALQCGEVLRSATLQECIEAIKTAVHTSARHFCAFLGQTLRNFCQYRAGLDNCLQVARGSLRSPLGAFSRKTDSESELIGATFAHSRRQFRAALKG